MGSPIGWYVRDESLFRLERPEFLGGHDHDSRCRGVSRFAGLGLVIATRGRAVVSPATRGPNPLAASLFRRDPGSVVGPEDARAAPGGRENHEANRRSASTNLLRRPTQADRPNALAVRIVKAA